MQSTYYLLSALLVAILQLVNGEISSPKEVYGIVGQEVKVMLNTTQNNSIKGVKFGLDGGKEDPFPKFITVVDNNGNIQVTCGDDLDYPAAESYKERVSFVGNLSIGHAWFIITNLKLNDTNDYMVSIREDSDGIYQHPGKIIKLIVTLPDLDIPVKQETQYEFTDFEGIAEKLWNSNVRRAKANSSLLAVIRKAYRNIPNKIDITYQREKNIVVRVGFHISFTKAVNQTYAFSFLQIAKGNAQLGGYNITCFNFTDKPLTKRKKEFTDFEGIAEKLWNSNVRRARASSSLLAVIRKAYRNIPNEIDITYQSEKSIVVRVGFHISFTKAVNQTYAFSFLQIAKGNAQLGGYSITCFNFTDKPFTKRNKGGHNPPGHPYDIGLIIGCVISGIIIIVISILLCYLCSCDRCLTWLGIRGNRSTSRQVDVAREPPTPN